MQLSTLFAFRPDDLLIPIRQWRKGGAWPDGTLAHVAAHVVAGPLWMVAGWWVFGLDLPHAVRFALVAQMVWEFLQQEMDARYPLWSILWDVAGAAAGASGAAALLRIFGT